METPIFLKPLSPKDKEEEKISKNSIHELNYHNKMYILTLSLSESNNLIFKLNEKESAKEEYINNFKLIDLKKLHKQFRLYDSETEVFETLNDILNTNSAFIQKEEDKFGIVFSFPLPGNKKQEINIPLKNKILKKGNLNDEIIKRINGLEKQLNKEIKDNKEYKKIIEENKKCIEECSNTLNELKKEVNELKNVINDLRNLKKDNLENKYKEKEVINVDNKKEIVKNFDSNIIKEKKEYELIENRLKITGSNKKIEYKLLYRATIDGDRAKIFHDKCDGKSGTLSIIETNNNVKFGGYTEAFWDGNGYKKDEKAFCFSLNLNKIYDVSVAEEAIQPQENLGPRFANTLFGIYDNAFKKGNRGGWCSYNNKHSQYGNIDNKEITGGQNNFGVSEIEVFEITFK